MEPVALIPIVSENASTVSIGGVVAEPTGTGNELLPIPGLRLEARPGVGVVTGPAISVGYSDKHGNWQFLELPSRIAMFTVAIVNDMFEVQTFVTVRANSAGNVILLPKVDESDVIVVLQWSSNSSSPRMQSNAMPPASDLDLYMTFAAREPSPHDIVTTAVNDATDDDTEELEANECEIFFGRQVCGGVELQRQGALVEEDRLSSCSPGCASNWLGDGTCNEQCDNPACKYDLGDCVFISNCDESTCPQSYQGDGQCDAACNTPGCHYDDGDCLSPETKHVMWDVIIGNCPIWAAYIKMCPTGIDSCKRDPTAAEVAGVCEETANLRPCAAAVASNPLFDRLLTAYCSPLNPNQERQLKDGAEGFDSSTILSSVGVEVIRMEGVLDTVYNLAIGNYKQDGISVAAGARLSVFTSSGLLRSLSLARPCVSMDCEPMFDEGKPISGKWNDDDVISNSKMGRIATLESRSVVRELSFGLAEMTTLSSQWDEDSVSGFLVDGNRRNEEYSSHTCVRTLNGEHGKIDAATQPDATQWEWWRVDLGDEYHIASVILTGSLVNVRSHSIEVLVGSFENHDNPENNVCGRTSTKRSTVSCNRPGRYVFIRQRGQLGLCQVQVMGSKTDVSEREFRLEECHRYHTQKSWVATKAMSFCPAVVDHCVNMPAVWRCSMNIENAFFACPGGVQKTLQFCPVGKRCFHPQDMVVDGTASEQEAGAKMCMTQQEISALQSSLMSGVANQVLWQTMEEEREETRQEMAAEQEEELEL
jgi:hypothetical protein